LYQPKQKIELQKIINNFAVLQSNAAWHLSTNFTRWVMSDFKKYRCTACGHIYDEAQGDPDSGIPAGTRWEDVPADWECPICRAPKSEFKLVS
jgi:rubredoxin